mmetsp:Transcript_59/g.165  ORF Transcript_59/g.165 Transcript_59/m.165 type:complete len:288 (+) Transcript_59:187-1050(+)
MSVQETENREAITANVLFSFENILSEAEEIFQRNEEDKGHGDLEASGKLSKLSTPMHSWVPASDNADVVVPRAAQHSLFSKNSSRQMSRQGSRADMRQLIEQRTRARKQDLQLRVFVDEVESSSQDDKYVSRLSELKSNPEFSSPKESLYSAIAAKFTSLPNNVAEEVVAELPVSDSISRDTSPSMSQLESKPKSSSRGAATSLLGRFLSQGGGQDTERRSMYHSISGVFKSTLVRDHTRGESTSSELLADISKLYEDPDVSKGRMSSCQVPLFSRTKTEALSSREM